MSDEEGRGGEERREGKSFQSPSSYLLPYLSSMFKLKEKWQYIFTHQKLASLLWT